MLNIMIEEIEEIIGGDLYPYTPSDADLREAGIRVDAIRSDRSGSWFGFWHDER
jgi:hypothetical protein